MKNLNLDEAIIKLVKQSVPNSISEIQRFITCKGEELLKLRADPDEDSGPYNESQLISVAILFAETKIGRLLKEIGADKDDRFLPEGIDRKECDFLIETSPYDQFIEDALELVVRSARKVPKWEFFKVGPNGEKILKRLVDEEIAMESKISETVTLKYPFEIDIEEVRNIAGPDFERVWAIFQRPNKIVTWKDLVAQAFIYRKVMA